jgi:hypothetical protein
MGRDCCTTHATLIHQIRAVAVARHDSALSLVRVTAGHMHAHHVFCTTHAAPIHQVRAVAVARHDSALSLVRVTVGHIHAHHVFCNDRFSSSLQLGQTHGALCLLHAQGRQLFRCASSLICTLAILASDEASFDLFSSTQHCCLTLSDFTAHQQRCVPHAYTMRSLQITSVVMRSLSLMWSVCALRCTQATRNVHT